MSPLERIPSPRELPGCMCHDLRWSTIAAGHGTDIERPSYITQIYEGTNQIQRVVMAQPALRTTDSTHLAHEKAPRWPRAGRQGRFSRPQAANRRPGAGDRGPADGRPPVRTLRRKDNIRCTQCGQVGLRPGFFEQVASSSWRSFNFLEWIEDALERGSAGNAKTFRRRRWQVDAFRCPSCGHLELFSWYLS